MRASSSAASRAGVRRRPRSRSRPGPAAVAPAPSDPRSSSRTAVVDPRDRGPDVPLGETDQRERRLGGPADAMGLAKGGLGAARSRPSGGGSRRARRTRRRAAGSRCNAASSAAARSSSRSARSHAPLRAVTSARWIRQTPGKPETRLALAVPLRGLGPLARAPVVGQVATGRDHRAAVTPVANGDSSPLTAAIDASSISAKPSDVAPVAILSAPRFGEGAWACRSGSAARLAISTASLGQRERGVDVAGLRGRLAADQGQVAVRVALAVGPSVARRA